MSAPPLLDDLALERRVVSVARRRVELWTVSPDRAIERLDERDYETNDRNPYFGNLWPSSKALSELLAERGSLAGRSVLDAGCGAGLCGIAAARLGGDVTFVDLMDEALRLARRNAAANGVDGRFERLDLRAIPEAARRYDLVLASDLVYEPWIVGPLLVALGRLLGAGGEARVVDPYRPAAQGFSARAEASGFTCVVTRRATGLDKKTHAVRVCALRRRREA